MLTVKALQAARLSVCLVSRHRPFQLKAPRAYYIMFVYLLPSVSGTSCFPQMVADHRSRSPGSTHIEGDAGDAVALASPLFLIPSFAAASPARKVVVVGNLPRDVDEAKLSTDFGCAGDIATVVVVWFNYLLPGRSGTSLLYNFVGAAARSPQSEPCDGDISVPRCNRGRRCCQQLDQLAPQFLRPCGSQFK